MELGVERSIPVRPRVLREGENVFFVHPFSGVLRWPLAGIFPICARVRMGDTAEGENLAYPERSRNSDRHPEVRWANTIREDSRQVQP